MLGPTIISMEVLLHTDTKNISGTFTGAALGYMMGAVVCGMLHTKFNKELQFICTSIGNYI